MINGLNLYSTFSCQVQFFEQSLRKVTVYSKDFTWHLFCITQGKITIYVCQVQQHRGHKMLKILRLNAEHFTIRH